MVIKTQDKSYQWPRRPQPSLYIPERKSPKIYLDPFPECNCTINLLLCENTENLLFVSRADLNQHSACFLCSDCFKLLVQYGSNKKAMTLAVRRSLASIARVCIKCKGTINLLSRGCTTPPKKLEMMVGVRVSNG